MGNQNEVPCNVTIDGYKNGIAALKDRIKFLTGALTTQNLAVVEANKLNKEIMDELLHSDSEYDELKGNYDILQQKYCVKSRFTDALQNELDEQKSVNFRLNSRLEQENRKSVAAEEAMLKIAEMVAKMAKEDNFHMSDFVSLQEFVDGRVAYFSEIV